MNETLITPGNIDKRAEALAAAEKEAADKAAAEAKTTGTEPEVKDEPKKDGVVDENVGKGGKDGKPAGQPQPKSEEKKQPNDPEELRKWATRSSQEAAKLREELAAMREEQKRILDTLTKATKKPVDLAELQKDPEKLKKYLEENEASIREEAESRATQVQMEATADVTRIEFERRKLDPTYPRWNELGDKMREYALKADTRINFNQHPTKVLDDLYALAQQEVAVPAPAAPAGKVYTEAEVAAMKEALQKEAYDKAQADLAAEGRGASVAGMTGGRKRSPTDQKEVYNEMPLNDLKNLIQKASE